MSQLGKFLAILRLELEDVQDDLESMMHVYQQRQSGGTLGENIIRSNTALFSKEIATIKDFIQELAMDAGTASGSMGDVMARINRELPARVQKFDYPLIVVDVLRRKMEKIRTYLEIAP